MSKKIVALSAWKYSGKSLAAQLLADKFGAQIVSFADPLKDMVAEEYGVARSWMDDPTHKEKPLLDLPVVAKDRFTESLILFMAGEFRTASGEKLSGDPYLEGGELKSYRFGKRSPPLFWTARALCILKGSTNRAVTPEYWTNLAMKAIGRSESDVVVIPDVRYRSEMGRLKEEFGSGVATVRINRFESSGSSDPSENDLNDYKFDYSVGNCKDKGYFLDQIESVAVNFLNLREKK